MLDHRKHSVLGVLVNATDYDHAVDSIMDAATERRPFAVSALAVHGVMTGVMARDHKYRLNTFELIVPDGQPVRWALNLMYKANLKDRVYGPELTLRVLGKAAELGIPVYLYGATDEILTSLQHSIHRRFQGLIVAGAEPSKFGHLTEQECIALAERIEASGAAIVLVGLGCPRQEVFTYEMRRHLKMPMLAVGAAFAFIGGSVKQAPKVMQDYGLEWLYRLIQEPRRLWNRYLVLNSYFSLLLLGQLFGLQYNSDGEAPVREIRYG